MEYPLSQEWHVAINKHATRQKAEKKEWPHFMYEGLAMAREVPRMAKLFKAEREAALPQVHKQCSHQEAVPVNDNHLTCCMGVKCRQCPHLLALESIDKCELEDIDTAKAWTCASHICASGGDHANEGYLLRVDDRMFWDRVHENLAMGSAISQGIES